MSFLESDSDLSKPYEYNAFKTPSASTGPPGRSTSHPPQGTLGGRGGGGRGGGGGGGGGGGKKPSKAAFTDAEIKILR